MSTSDPNSAIFLTDTPEQIKEKVKKKKKLFKYIQKDNKTCILWWWFDKEGTLREGW